MTTSVWPYDCVAVLSAVLVPAWPCNKVLPVATLGGSLTVGFSSGSPACWQRAQPGLCTCPGSAPTKVLGAWWGVPLNCRNAAVGSPGQEALGKRDTALDQLVHLDAWGVQATAEPDWASLRSHSKDGPFQKPEHTESRERVPCSSTGWPGAIVAIWREREAPAARFGSRVRPPNGSTGRLAGETQTLSGWVALAQDPPSASLTPAPLHRVLQGVLLGWRHGGARWDSWLGLCLWRVSGRAASLVTGFQGC